MINIDDFSKLDIRIGEIIDAERIPAADKLLKLIIDVGDEERQVLAGIAEHYPEPEVLVGKKIPVLVNIEPRKLRGLESQGMILAASSDDGLALLHPDRKIDTGSKVK